MVNGLGIGLGMFIWGSVQVTVGWCVARFGLFGTRAQPVYNNAMNITGLVLTLISGVIFFLVKHEDSGRTAAAAAADNAAAAITATESTEMESDGSDSATTDKSDAELRNDDRQHQASARQNNTNLAIAESRVQGHGQSHDTRRYAIFHQQISTKKLVSVARNFPSSIENLKILKNSVNVVIKA
ncbi:unnamed protein product [Anisakis simplex]|uniref:Uncharacterized protein n=1 Tax=Anisakis simplex TaxID=6269 RepID=A0A3P6NIY1_ANISI|nr:unnamed protein product [Anisakis simplex]